MASNYDQRLRSVAAGFPELAGLSLTISAEVGWRKPAAQFFAAMCGNLHTSADKILYIGDDLVNDYEGAAAAGVSVLLYDPHGRHKTGIPRLERLGDLIGG